MSSFLKRVFACFSIMSLLIISGCDKSETPPKNEEVKVISNNIYDTPKNPTPEQIVVFNELSNSLKSNASDEKVASLVAVNFAYDFYSLYGKESKSDIGGLQFIPEISREEFTSYASYKYYHNYDSVVTNYSADDLPYVISHQVKNTNASQLMYNQLLYEGYEVSLNLTYKESKLKVDTLKSNVTMKVINNNGIFQVIAAED